MNPRTQLRAANALMTAGVLPWLLVLAWVAAFLATAAPGRPPTVPMLDPLGMIGLMGMVFLFAACVAGLGAFWSWILTRDGELPGTGASQIFRGLVLLALLGPLLLVWGLAAFS